MKNKLTNNNLQEILNNIKNRLLENKKALEELLKIDEKYCTSKIDLNSITKLIEQFKKQQIEESEQFKYKIIYNGNPYITINLCILAILTQNIIILDYNEIWKGINKFLIETIKDELKNYNIEHLICENISNIHKTIYIDDINKYNIALKNNTNNIKFYSFNYTDLYSDSDEFEELQEIIYKYANTNNIPIEVYSELEINEAVQMIRNGLGKRVIILTNNNETKNVFQKNINNKELYINKNPFKDDLKIINKEIFL